MKRLKITFLSIILSLGSLNAQIPNTLYFMPGVPQSNRINPAIQPGCSFYLGLPTLSPLRVQLTSSSLAVSDFIFPSPVSDSLITPFHPDADRDEFISKLAKKNFFATDVGISLVSVGFNVRKSFFSFDISTRMESAIYYPRGLFQLPDLFRYDSIINLSGFGMDMMLYNEISLGWSRRDFFIPNLDIGVRGKLLLGLGNIATKSSVFEITGSSQSFSLHTDYQIGVSTPPILYNFEGWEANLTDFQLPELGIQSLSSLTPSEIVKSLISKQFGFAVDFGANYRPIPQLYLSASLLDLGFINWGNGVVADLEYDFTFGGLPGDAILGGGIDSVLTSITTSITDSLFNAVHFTSGEAYATRTNTKLFIGAGFYPIEKIGFGLLSRTDFLNSKVTQQFTGSVNMTTGKFLNLSLTASYAQRRINNVGAGLSVNLGPFNGYFISDNIISAALSPLSARSINLWLGVNTTFGWKRMKQARVKKDKELDYLPTDKKIDRPLIW